MIAALAMVFMGWPAILASLLVSVIGIVWKRPALLVTGAVICLGFAWYLRAWPNLLFDILGYALPFTHLLGALAVYRRRPWIAWPLLLPHAGIAAYLASIVLSQ